MWRVPHAVFTPHSGDTCRLGGMVDALDSKSSSLKECGFESHSRYEEKVKMGGGSNATALYFQ